jgi:hypothetical protein
MELLSRLFLDVSFSGGFTSIVSVRCSSTWKIMHWFNAGVSLRIQNLNMNIGLKII